MTNQPHTELIEQARAVLADNWVGAFTKPSPRLYPHQWSWDSAFIAIGYARYDQARAEQELRSLFAGQWTNGMLPHIVFNPAASDYFPGPHEWHTVDHPHKPQNVQTTGIVQPPVHATAALHVFRHAQDTARAHAFLAELFPRLRDWHAYLYRERDPRGEGLVYIEHPWESGQDNSPLWDAALERITIDPDQIPSFQRVDITIVDPIDRPTKTEYDYYMYLVKLLIDRDYDDARIRADFPFLIQDVLFNTLLCQASRDLAEIARIVGESPGIFEAWAAQTASAIDAKLWDEQHGIYINYDLVADAPVDVHVAAGFTPLFAGVPDQARAERMYRYLNSDAFCALDDACYPVPCYDRHAPGYLPNRYWRGPVWINVDWAIYHGLRRYGFEAYAAWMRQRIIELVRDNGFFEHFTPETGAGHGTDQFSWTAALLIDLALG
ncbi:MAG TPA: trehalase family glycosidase [Herpetosiphonaceae bacterium]